MELKIKMVIHLRKTSFDHKHHAYLCRNFGHILVKSRWTTDKDKVTCKNCLNKMKTDTYIVLKEYKIN